jgi:putative hydrolase
MTQGGFPDIPLFREIQRLLQSQGPVNQEIARQVGQAIAAGGEADPGASSEETRSFQESVRASEEIVAGYSRIPVAEPARTKPLTRAQWVAETIPAWEWLLASLSAVMGEQLSALGPEPEQGQAQMIREAMGQIAPLLLGIQLGTLAGHLSLEVLGRHDFPVPRDDDRRLFFVPGNIAKVAEEYDLAPGSLMTWIALRGATLSLINEHAPWLQRYQKALLTELVESIELDAAEAERRMLDLQTKGFEMMQTGMGAEQMLPILPTERHSRAQDRVKSLIALLEGYSKHVTRSVAGSLIGDQAPRIEEGLVRRRAVPREGRKLLSAVLGISFDRQLEDAGETFCNAVVSLHGMAALNRVWEAPDNLPSASEIRDPFTWIERVLQD